MKCITLLDDKNANFHLDRKKVIFSHAYRGLSRSFHGVTIHVKPPGFKQLNWRIREHLSQAINNGSWYKLSFLVSEDAMIVPATCIHSVWRFAQTSWDMVSKVFFGLKIRGDPLPWILHWVGIQIVFKWSSKCTPCKWRVSLILTRRLWSNV